MKLKNPINTLLSAGFLVPVLRRWNARAEAQAPMSYVAPPAAESQKVNTRQSLDILRSRAEPWNEYMCLFMYFVSFEVKI
jgi:hypothetical protein